VQGSGQHGAFAVAANITRNPRESRLEASPESPVESEAPDNLAATVFSLPNHRLYRPHGRRDHGDDQHPTCLSDVEGRLLSHRDWALSAINL